LYYSWPTVHQSLRAEAQHSGTKIYSITFTVLLRMFAFFTKMAI